MNKVIQNNNDKIVIIQYKDGEMLSALDDAVIKMKELKLVPMLVKIWTMDDMHYIELYCPSVA